MIKNNIPENWKILLQDKIESDDFNEFCEYIEKEYEEYTVYPAKEDIFNAIKGLNPQDIKVVIIGQDPYHEPEQAHGLSFSVKDGAPIPKSLNNIYKELSDDIGCQKPTTGCLNKWKEQGVLLLNSCLTVRKGNANSHQGKGWEQITSEIIKIVLEQEQPKVFILWGKFAYKTFYSIYNQHQYKNVYCISSAHPSPFSAYRGFFGSKPFSKANNYLKNHGVKEIKWA